MYNFQGYYLKELREQYGLSQTKVGGEVFSRSKVSNIEKGSCTVDEKTAKILIGNINLLLESRNIEAIDYLYIYDHELFDRRIDANRIYSKLEELYEQDKPLEFNETLEKFNNEFALFSIPDVKHRAFKLAGKHYILTGEYYRAYSLFARGIDNAIMAGDEEQTISLTAWMYSTLGKIGDKKEAIFRLKELFEKYPNMVNLQRLSIYENIAYIYMGIEDFKSAILEFEASSRYIDENIPLLKINHNIDLALCYLCTEQYMRAILMLDEALMLTDQSQIVTQLMIYIDRISIYIKTDERNEVIKCLDIIIPKFKYIEKDSKAIDILALYYEIGDVYEYLENYSEAESYFVKADIESKNRNNYKMQNYSFKKLLNVYIKLGDIKKIDILYEKVCELLMHHPDQHDNESVIFQLMELYMKINQVEKCIRILKIIQNKGGEGIYEKENILNTVNGFNGFYTIPPKSTSNC